MLLPEERTKGKNMSSSLFVGDLQDQICYVHCGLCTTILLVSVPCSSLTEVVTVKCGHCNCLLSVNMTKLGSFLPLQLFNPPFKQADDQEQKKEPSETAGIPSPVVSFSSSSDEEEDEEDEEIQEVFNKPPEKRQRPPSAYNLFIGEEIQRLKAVHPTITHKQAFSMAAKNWAHFPMSEQRREDIRNMTDRQDKVQYRCRTTESGGFH